jgi:hypothetical protein
MKGSRATARYCWQTSVCRSCRAAVGGCAAQKRSMVVLVSAAEPPKPAPPSPSGAGEARDGGAGQGFAGNILQIALCGSNRRGCAAPGRRWCCFCGRAAKTAPSFRFRSFAPDVCSCPGRWHMARLRRARGKMETFSAAERPKTFPFPRFRSFAPDVCSCPVRGAVAPRRKQIPRILHVSVLGAGEDVQIPAAATAKWRSSPSTVGSLR